MPSKISIDILRLKIVIDDLSTAEEENRLGFLDFKSVLTEFQDRVDNQQKDHFDNQFKEVIGSQQAHKVNCSSSKEIVLSEHVEEKVELRNKTSDKIKPAWAKQLYKGVVQRTHPDRFIDFPIKEIKNKYTKIYMQAVDAYENNKLGVLLLCAYETEIEYSHIKEAGEYIKKESDETRSRIAFLNSQIGYQWYHLSESQRLVFLENYLKMLGYKFNEVKARDEIQKSKKKRRVGQRPEKLFRVKRKEIK